MQKLCKYGRVDEMREPVGRTGQQNKEGTGCRPYGRAKRTKSGQKNRVCLRRPVGVA